MRFQALVLRATRRRPASNLQCRRGILTDNAFFKIRPEVRDAVMGQRPVVALETTIYTHGFPYPENIALSQRLEKVVRENGAIPASIGVLNGVITVGMSAEESRELLETSRQPTTVKLSRRDISYICGLGFNGRMLNGGTTISGTMVLAHLAGIKIFATGGLGGVHRGGEHSMDVSADLTELGRTPVTVISSGCKSFLDIPRTLEYLETQGAGVATFADGRDGHVDFPAFWTRDSGIKSPKTIRDEQEAAAIVYAHSKLQLNSGLFFASPIPEEYSIPQSVMNQIIEDAVAEAARHGATGSDNTPFVLDHIHKVTNGASIKANRALVENNVIRGAKIAVALARLEKGDEYSDSYTVSQKPRAESKSSTQPLRIVVAGSLAVDLSCDYKPIVRDEDHPILHTSNPASISQSLGGVGHNIATAIHYAKGNVQLIAPVGDDLAGSAAIANLKARGLDTKGIRAMTNGISTPQYVVLNNQNKDLFVAMADMRLLESIDNATIDSWTSELKGLQPEWLVIDTNWSSDLIRKWVAAGRAAGAKIAFEPVSEQKSSRLFYKTWQDHLQSYSTASDSTSWRNRPDFLADLVTPNQFELAAMAKSIRSEAAWPSLLSKLEPNLPHLLRETVPGHEELTIHAMNLLSNFSCIFTKLGPYGVLQTEILLNQDPRLTDPQHTGYILLQKQPEPTIPHTQWASPYYHHLLPHVDPESSISQVEGVYIRLWPAHKIPAENIISVNGVGDTFLGVLLAASMNGRGQYLSEAVDIAQQASLLTLQSGEAISPRIRDLFP